MKIILILLVAIISLYGDHYTECNDDGECHTVINGGLNVPR